MSFKVILYFLRLATLKEKNMLHTGSIYFPLKVVTFPLRLIIHHRSNTGDFNNRNLFLIAKLLKHSRYQLLATSWEFFFTSMLSGKRLLIIYMERTLIFCLNIYF